MQNEKRYPKKANGKDRQDANRKKRSATKKVSE